MEKIYNLLAKHFQKTATPEEERRIVDFRRENPFEYRQLKSLWFSKEKITIHEFDTDAGWKKVVQQAKPPLAKVIPFYREKIGRVAAAVVLLLLTSVSGYYFLKELKNSESRVMVEVKATQGNELVVLDDGSKVWLNDNAILSYPKIFDKNDRRVMLHGEAFFEIEKNPNRPFVVETSNSMTRVLGTSFNVNTNQNITEVTVATGRVEVRSSTNEKVVVTPGFTAEVKGATVSSFANTNVNYLSWKTGRFTFIETELAKVVADLNTYHNGQIKLGIDTVTTCKITADFDAVSLAEIMEMIALTCDLTISRLDAKYLIQ